MTTAFTPLEALLGGGLIGLAAVLLMATTGRIAGATGILAGVVPPRIAPDWSWRAAFLLGAVSAPAVYWLATGGMPTIQVPVSPLVMAVSGLIVGIGVTFGAGCTSGHGVCGLARLSPRSLVATLVFMAATFATVFVVRHVLGG